MHFEIKIDKNKVYWLTLMVIRHLRNHSIHVSDITNSGKKEDHYISVISLIPLSLIKTFI